VTVENKVKLQQLRCVRGCLKSPELSPEPPPCPPILGGSEIEVPQNWGLKAFQAYMKRGQVQGL